MNTESTKYIFMFISDTENHAGDVEFGPQMICIAETEKEAYQYFWDTHPYFKNFWEQDERDQGREGDFDALNIREKETIIEWKMGYDRRTGHDIEKIPLYALEGLDSVLIPFKQKIKQLENKVKIEALRGAINSQNEYPLLPNEILHFEIKKHL